MVAFQKTLNRYLNRSHETRPWGLTFPVLTWPNTKDYILKNLKKKAVKIFNHDNIWNNMTCNDKIKLLLCILYVK